MSDKVELVFEDPKGELSPSVWTNLRFRHGSNKLRVTRLEVRFGRDGLVHYVTFEPETRRGRRILSQEEMAKMDCPFPPEEEYDRDDV